MASKILTPSNIAALAVVISAYLLTRNSQLSCILGVVNLVALYGSRELLVHLAKKQVIAQVAAAPAPATPGAAPTAAAATPAVVTSS